jgi:aerobic carbon-monoxide dehydrogenase large subunit
MIPENQNLPQTSKEVCGMGHSMKRKEDPRFIRGQGRYVDDVTLPGMLFMDIVRSPFAHAKIVKIDTSRALKVPGVLAVITGETLKQYNLHWMPTLMSDTQMVLPTEKVMYQAQEVAAVIATRRSSPGRLCCGRISPTRRTTTSSTGKWGTSRARMPR